MRGVTRQAVLRAVRFHVLVVILVVTFAMILVKGLPGQEDGGPSWTGGEAPAALLDRALAANRPTVAFFHSVTCGACREMTATLGVVYPEYESSVVLVDVDRRPTCS